MKAFTIARVDRATGLVVNIEVATQSWIDAQSDSAFAFIPYTENAPAMIGGTWDGTDFIPPAAPDAVAP